MKETPFVWTFVFFQGVSENKEFLRELNSLVDTFQEDEENRSSKRHKGKKPRNTYRSDPKFISFVQSQAICLLISVKPFNTSPTTSSPTRIWPQ